MCLAELSMKKSSITLGPGVALKLPYKGITLLYSYKYQMSELIGAE